MKKLAVLLLFLLLFGCTYLPKKKEIEIKHINIIASNFSHLLSFNTPFICNISINNSKTLLAKIYNGLILYETNNFTIIQNSSNLLIKLPKDKEEEFNCSWVMVNTDDEVYKLYIAKLFPYVENLDNLPGENFNCEVYFPNKKEFLPQGKICWFFDLK